MIICHCKCVFDRELKKCKTIKEAIIKYEATTGCGNCAPEVHKIIEGEKMATYEYECTDCGHTWEKEQKMNDPKTTTCPKCGKETAKRLISGGTSFQLKGKGWFKTGGY
jgi:putative FmdB family regulatory protein